ncbi:MAG: hypothetical protein ABI670_21945 [Chloroflexota bacterium]
MAKTVAEAKMEMFFRVWFDDDKKKLTADKITDACRNYQAKIGKPANVCLVNIADIEEPQEIHVDGELVNVRVAANVNRWNYFAGNE